MAATKNGNGKAVNRIEGALVERSVEVKPPNFQEAMFDIEGIAPLVINRFSNKAKEQMKATQEAGSTARGKKKREPKDFQALCESAKHVSVEGWCGIPASAFRNAMISACRTVGFAMTKAKLAFFVIEDGYDCDGFPLVKITKGEPTYHESYVRNETGVVDIRPRPMWPVGWRASVRVRFDADMFTHQDIANLLARAGLQVGVGEGRPDSKKSAGMGWGMFKVGGK